jgi:hypothetical protein
MVAVIKTVNMGLATLSPHQAPYWTYGVVITSSAPHFFTSPTPSRSRFDLLDKPLIPQSSIARRFGRVTLRQAATLESSSARLERALIPQLAGANVDVLLDCDRAG